MQSHIKDALMLRASELKV